MEQRQDSPQARATQSPLPPPPNVPGPSLTCHADLLPAPDSAENHHSGMKAPPQPSRRFRRSDSNTERKLSAKLGHDTEGAQALAKNRLLEMKTTPAPESSGNAHYVNMDGGGEYPGILTKSADNSKDGMLGMKIMKESNPSPSSLASLSSLVDSETQAKSSFAPVKAGGGGNMNLGSLSGFGVRLSGDKDDKDALNYTEEHQAHGVIIFNDSDDGDDALEKGRKNKKDSGLTQKKNSTQPLYSSNRASSIDNDDALGGNGHKDGLQQKGKKYAWPNSRYDSERVPHSPPSTNVRLPDTMMYGRIHDGESKHDDGTMMYGRGGKHDDATLMYDQGLRHNVNGDDTTMYGQGWRNHDGTPMYSQEAKHDSMNYDAHSGPDSLMYDAQSRPDTIVDDAESKQNIHDVHENLSEENHGLGPQLVGTHTSGFVGTSPGVKLGSRPHTSTYYRPLSITLEKIQVVLRLGGMVFSVIAFSIMFSTNETRVAAGSTFHVKFSDFQAYNYLVALNVLSFLYSSGQLIVFARPKSSVLTSPIRGAALVYICDQILAFLLISSSSSAATTSGLSHNGLRDIWPPACATWNLWIFCSKADSAIAMAFLSSLLVTMSSFFSGYHFSVLLAE